MAVKNPLCYYGGSQIEELHPGDTVTGAGGGGGVTSPLTTKGDVWGFTTGDARVGVGADGTALRADSSQASGVRYYRSAAEVVFMQQNFF